MVHIQVSELGARRGRKSVGSMDCAGNATLGRSHGLACLHAKPKVSASPI